MPFSNIESVQFFINLPTVSFKSQTKMNPKLVFGAIVLIAGLYIRESSSSSFMFTQPFLNEFQTRLREELHSTIEKDPPHQYMKEVSYLLHLLSMKNFNNSHMSLVLKECINLLDFRLEKYGFVEDCVPYEFNVYKKNRPVLYYNFRAVTTSPKSTNRKDVKRFNQFLAAKMLEDVNRKVRGSNNTHQYDIVINLKGFSMETHGRTACFPTYTELSENAVAAENIFIINAPSAVETIYSAIANSNMLSPYLGFIKIFSGPESYKNFIYIHEDNVQARLMNKAPVYTYKSNSL